MVSFTIQAYLPLPLYNNISILLCYRSIDLEMAIAYWNIVMKGRFKFLDLWCTFLKVIMHVYL